MKNKLYLLLRKSEKYFKTDMVYLVAGGFWLTSAQFISSASVFLLAIVFANLIPKETYGTYKYVLSVTGVLALVTLKGMDSAVTYGASRGIEGVFFPALKAKIKWGSLTILGSILLSGYYYLNGNNALAEAFFLISFFLPFVDTLGIYANFLQGKKLFRISSIYGIITQIGSTAIIIVGLFFTKNLIVILFIYFASWTSFRLFFFLRTIKKFPPNDKYDLSILSYGKHSSIVNMLDALITSIDGLLIFHYLGPVELAVYSFAIAPVSQIRSLFSNIPTLAIPRLATRHSKDIDLVIKKRVLILLIIGILLSLAYILSAEYIYRLFFPKYLEAVFFSQLFSIAIALSLPQVVFGAAVSSKITLIPKKMLYLWNIPGIIFIILSIGLVQIFGISGIILGRLFSLATTFIINYVAWEKIKKVEAAES